MSGAGNSTNANALERRLFTSAVRSYLLDGNSLWHGLNRDLGFTPADRVGDFSRAEGVPRLMMDAGWIVYCAFIPPCEAERQIVRSMIGPAEFFEFFVDVPMPVAETRGPKCLYAKSSLARFE